MADCKTAFAPAAQYKVGDRTAGRAVGLLEIKILVGRGVEQPAELTAQELAVLEAYVHPPAAIGVEVTQLDRETYRVVHHPGRAALGVVAAGGSE